MPSHHELLLALVSLVLIDHHVAGAELPLVGRKPKTAEAGKAPLTDLFGDPLPDGALARFGTRDLRWEFQKAVFRAAYDFIGYPYRLAYVEGSTAKVGWVADVWASCWASGSSGSYQPAWVEVTQQGNRVVVFGVACSGFHVEAFRADDGINVLRFSNSYSR
jgi:hypothetical protein